MKYKFQRLLFKSIMKKQASLIIKDVEIVQLFYPITRQQIIFPIRNTKCNEERKCIIPLDRLMQKVEDSLQIGELYEPKSDSIQGMSFQCQMCCEVNKKCKRFYSDFYYDRKLDFLIKKAKERYRQDYFSFVQQSITNLQKIDQGMKSKAINNFKFSKLYIYQTGEVFLQYNRKVKGTQLTIRVNIFENNLINYSQKLKFNPNDYKNDFSTLKIVQNISQRKTGQLLQNGFQDVTGIYTKQYKRLLQKKITSSIKQGMKMGQINMIRQQQCYAVRLFISQQYRNQGLIQLYVFYPRYNLTQRYVNERIQAAIRKTQRNKVRLIKLADRMILLYTEETSFIFSIQPPESSLIKRTSLLQNRPVIIKNKRQTVQAEEMQKQTLQYLQLSQNYNEVTNFKYIFDSIRPAIENPIVIAAPWNQKQIFVISGSIQSTRNKKVYKLQFPNKQSKDISWIDQKNELNLPYDSFVTIFEGFRLFLLAFMKQESEYRMSIIELQSKNNCLQIKQQHDLNMKIPICHLYPLRQTQNSYFLVDLTGQEKTLKLNLQNFQIAHIPNLQNQYIKDTLRIKNLNSIIQSFPSCSVNHNQINYNILTNCIRTPIFKILYGCSDQWLISDIGESLIND